MQWSDTTNNTGILQEIRRSLRQPATGGLWLDTDLLRRANIIMRSICEQSECLRLLDTSNTSISGTAAYNKPTGCSRIIGVAYGTVRIFGVLKSELDMISLQSGQVWQTLSGGCANGGRYIDYPTTIQLIPAPTDTGTTVTIEYMAQPTELANVTDIPFNALSNLYSFHDIIAAGVVYRCLLEEKNQFYSEWKGIYDRGIARLKDFVRDMPDTLMTTILVGGGGGRNISPLPGSTGF